MLTTLAVENYRSLRRVVLPLAKVNVITGTNGSGKSSLYRALRLLAEASRNGAVAALAQEGGLPSTLWAGPRPELARKTPPVALRLGFAGDDYGYAIDLGLPVPDRTSMFGLDPEIKAEAIWHGPLLRPSTLLTQRTGPVVQVRSSEGAWERAEQPIRSYDSMLGELADPHNAPEVLAVRELVRSWRFYDHLRTDADAPARTRARVGTRTPVLDPDGADLAAALQTVREVGDATILEATIARAFPGSWLEIESEHGQFSLRLGQPGLVRPLRAAELSDGTLRYLLLAAALLSPRPPQLLVLNEPETSLHPDLLAPLAHLVTAAAAGTQIVLVTHAQALIRHLQAEDQSEGTDTQVIRLVKADGETGVEGRTAFDEPPWQWPTR